MGKISSLISGYKKRGLIEGIRWSSAHLFQEVLVRKFPTDTFDYPRTNVLDEEWDLLVLLDGCRVDTLQQVSGEYDWLPEEIGSKYSVAGGSQPWMERTFGGRTFDSLSYISGNPHTELVLRDQQFHLLDEVWQYSWDHDIGTIRPRPITDRTISHFRSEETGDQVIAHYMQPHFPSLTHPSLGSEMSFEEVGSEWSGNIWDQLVGGKVERETVIEAYRDNLRAVLNDVEVLIENVDAETVVISADHGNAIGERGYYGHGDFRVPEVRQVPWVEVSASDSGEYTPETRKTADEYSVEDRLESLGYM
jgi:hypothetical protein